MCYSLRMENASGLAENNNIVNESKHMQTLQASASSPLHSKNSLETKSPSRVKVDTGSVHWGPLKKETVGKISFAAQDKVFLF